MTDVISNVVADAISGLKSLFNRQYSDLVTIMRQPTPVKISKVVQADASGSIGGGLTIPNAVPVELWMCPISFEAWVNRITVTSPGHPPNAPLTTGQVWCAGSNGEPIFFLPLGGNVAPVQITEGRISAPHLNSGEFLTIAADTLPANTSLRLDLQIVLVTGSSNLAPNTFGWQNKGNLDLTQ